MAFVVLPCDLPHWRRLEKKLSALSTVTNTKHLIDGMFSIHKLCSTGAGLDPDEPEYTDPNMFSQLENFLSNLPKEEQFNFYNKILPSMIRRAMDLKAKKPPDGFHFSLQQQRDEIAYKRSFLASLLAHSFFSTFPTRTRKTHPTLQNFNFTLFFKFLDQGYQQAKLKSIFYYFELLGSVIDENECVTYSRQVISGQQQLTIKDCVECCLPLCPMVVRNTESLSEVGPPCLGICFSSSKIGGSVLCRGSSQESIEFCTIPELICILAFAEALQDNEVFFIKDACRISNIMQSGQRVIFEKLEEPVRLYLCCMNAEKYSGLPLSQLEECNILRELNKAFLGFSQGKPSKLISNSNPLLVPRTLPAFEDTFTSSLSQNDPTTNGSSTKKELCFPFDMNKFKSARIKQARPTDSSIVRSPIIENQSLNEYSERMSIVTKDGIFCSAQSAEVEEDDFFYSAQESLDEENEDFDSDMTGEERLIFGTPKMMVKNLKDEKNSAFAERLREALLRRAETYSNITDHSSFDVDLSVAPSGEEDNISYERGTSIGFFLKDEAEEKDGFYQNLSGDEPNQERINESDKYSFTTKSSDADHFTKCMEATNNGLGIDKYSEQIVSRLESMLQKRAFSDTCAVSEKTLREIEKLNSIGKSYSFELAKLHATIVTRLACLTSQKYLSSKSMMRNGHSKRPVVTGNWNYGTCQSGDPQIKLIIQWLAASYIGLPNFIYYTCMHPKLVKLDTVKRILTDRGWTVGQLAACLVQYSQTSIQNTQSSTIFDLLITTSRS